MVKAVVDAKAAARRKTKTIPGKPQEGASDFGRAFLIFWF